MSVYRRILVLVDLSDDSLPIGRRAQAIAANLGAQVEFLHVAALIPPDPVGETLMPAVQLEKLMLAQARTRLTALAAALDLPNAYCQVEVGIVKSDIIRIARERRADLIVLGSRERHGLSILVNFTEDTVLHEAPCDVLAVRVDSPGK